MQVPGIYLITSFVISLSAPMAFSQQISSSDKDTLNESATEHVSQNSDTELSTSSTIRVIEAVVCREVLNRIPQEPSDTFSVSTEALSCYCKISTSEFPVTIAHKWYFGNELINTIPLSINAESWRTYSTKKILPQQIGQWRVEIVEPGTKSILKTIHFHVKS